MSIAIKRAKKKSSKRKQEHHKPNLHGSAGCKNMEYCLLVLPIDRENLTVMCPLIIMEQQIFSDSVIAKSTSFPT